MGDLLSYRLTDFMPFSPDVYSRLFTLQNEAVWPAQIVAVLVGAVIAWRAWAGDDRTVAAGLAVAWVFVGWTFFVQQYQNLLWAAPYIGAAFFAQAALFGLAAWRGWLRLSTERNAWTWTGLGLALVGLTVVPLVAPLAGRAWSGVELFGIAPTPTVAVTLGLILAANRVTWGLLVIPILWCVIAGLTAIAMNYAPGFTGPTVGALALVVAAIRGVAGR